MLPSLFLLSLLACTRTDDSGPPADDTGVATSDTGDSDTDDSDTDDSDTDDSDTDDSDTDDSDTNDSDTNDSDPPPVDADADGYPDSDDCNDSDPLVFPGAVEQCNGADDDCDGVVDNDVVARDWYIDADADGWGDENAGAPISDCKAQPGRSDRVGDCDDSDATANPSGTEICDDIDQDCDGEVLDDADLIAPAADRQLGVCESSRKVCAASGWVEPDYATIGDYEPTEISCDGLDNDCSGTADDLHSSATIPLADRQLGVCESSRKVCFSGGFAEPDYAAIPDYEVTEATCDGLDNDCSGEADNVDADGDGHRPIACGGEDCDDSRDNVAPGLPEDGGSNDERPDGLDNDCNNAVDDGLAYGNGSDGALTLSADSTLADLGFEAWELELERNSVNNEWGLDFGSDITAVEVSDTLLVYSVNVSSKQKATQQNTPGVFAVCAVTGIDGSIAMCDVDLIPAGTVNGTKQVVRVPQYTSVTLEEGVTLRVDAWDGFTGGVLPLMATDGLSLKNNARITAEASGFRGGKADSPKAGQDEKGSTGEQGEGRRRFAFDLWDGTPFRDVGVRSYENNDIGGGGGGRLEGEADGMVSNGCAECTCSGGGGDHYTPFGTDLTYYHGDCGDQSYATVDPQPGEFGDSGALPDPMRPTFGGGGGAGSAPVFSGGFPGHGGAGGGLVWLAARTVTLEKRASLSARGGEADNVLNRANYAAGSRVFGGAGAGGSLWVRTGELTLANQEGFLFDRIDVLPGEQAINFTGSLDQWPGWGGAGAYGAVSIYADVVQGEAVQSGQTPSALANFPQSAFLHVAPVDESR